MGAKMIALACKLDELNTEEAKTIGRRYYKESNHHNFNFLEVSKWIE